MTSFSKRLSDFFHERSYPQGWPVNRWGQLLRQTADLKAVLDRAQADGRLVPLHKIANIHGGAVTRANAYFIVRELTFSQAPKRFKLTRQDYKRVAVAMDGLEVPCRIERRFLRSIIKGPEDLATPSAVDKSDRRLLFVNVSKDELKKQRANGTLEYLHRGETISYRVSEDSLKGGIPARRNNVKNRKPFWYSISVHESPGPRIIVPEHIDKRYIATLSSSDSVVIDKLFIIDPRDPAHAPMLLAALNSVLTWYQLELRGRTQLGQGVLELKVPDWLGVLVLNPDTLTAKERRRLISAFKPLSTQYDPESLESVGNADRVEFDLTYLDLADLGGEELRLEVERALRAAAAERRERRESVAESRLEKSKSRNVAATIDAYATKLAAVVEPFPDPRLELPEGVETKPVPIIAPVEGSVVVGSDLFTHGNVYAGDTLIAEADTPVEARYVRGVLLHDPTVQHVDVPRLLVKEVVQSWEERISEWRVKFKAAKSRELSAITDKRLVAAITERALELLHAQ